MIITYDFILTARRDKAFREQLNESLLSDSDSEICTQTHRLTFRSNEQTVIVTPKSDTIIGIHKFVPKKITYEALIKMLHDDWDSIEPDDIADL